MSRFTDCYPHPAGIRTLDYDPTSSCPRCGHQVMLHSIDRACAACEQMNVLAASVESALVVFNLATITAAADAEITGPPMVQCPATYYFNAVEYQCLYSRYHETMHESTVHGHSLKWPKGYAHTL